MGQKENSNISRPPLRAKSKLHRPSKTALRSVKFKPLEFSSENARAAGKAEVKHKFLRATAPPGWAEIAGEKAFNSGSLPRTLRVMTGKEREQHKNKENIVEDEGGDGKDCFQSIRSNKGKERESEEVSLESKIRSAIAKHNQSGTVKSVKWDPSIVHCGPVTDLVKNGEEYAAVPMSEKEKEKEKEEEEKEFAILEPAKENELNQKEHAVPASEKPPMEKQPGISVSEKALKKKRIDIRTYMPWTEKGSYIRDTATLRTRARQLVSPTVVKEDSIEECFKTITQWTKGDRKKLRMLMEALKATDSQDVSPLDLGSPVYLPGIRNITPESDPKALSQTTPTLKARKCPSSQDISSLDIGSPALEKTQDSSLPTKEGRTATRKGILDPEAPSFRDFSTLKARKSYALKKKSVVDVESPTLLPTQRALCCTIGGKRCNVQVPFPPSRDFTTPYSLNVRKTIDTRSLPNVSVTRTRPKLSLENFNEPLWIPSSVVTAIHHLPGTPFSDLVTITKPSNSTPDENEQGRTAFAMDERLARPLLARFISKYPLTGTKKAPLRPRVMPTTARGKYAADLQQQLEFILLQKKEKQALEKIFGKAH